MNRPAIAILATIVSAPVPPLTHAGPLTGRVPSQTVEFADLDLSHMEGVSLLYYRLRRAAQRTCSPFEGRELERRRRYQNCVDGVVAAAVADVDRPLLTEYHRSRANARDVELAATD